MLLVGAIGTGKTTTGMALLNAGWRLLANDAPLIDTSGHILSYPGLLAAYPDTFARFPATAHLAQADTEQAEQCKITVPAEAIWPNVWTEQAVPAVICFPQVEPRADHALEPLRPPEALRRLLPHAIERWDEAMIPAHLRVLRGLVEAAPAYRLRLGPDVLTIPELLKGMVQEGLAIRASSPDYA